MSSKAKRTSQEKNHLMKSSWFLGKTCTVRIPIKIKEQILDIARFIDIGGKIFIPDHERTDRHIQNGKTILSQDNLNDSDLDIPFSDDLKISETILSQDTIDEIIKILKHGITSKRQGGVYDSSNASTLKKQVIKALTILES